MGKKIVLIVVQITRKRKGHKTTERDTDVQHVAGSFRIIPADTGSIKSFGVNINLPYLFTCQKYVDLGIPNMTNSLDGCFAYLKEFGEGPPRVKKKPQN